MITEAFLNLLFAVFEGVLALVPAWSLPSQLTGWAGTLGTQAAGVNAIFPIVTVGVCLAILLGLWVFLAAWDALVWVYEHIPFIGG